jgi:hypothetical protein
MAEPRKRDAPTSFTVRLASAEDIFVDKMHNTAASADWAMLAVIALPPVAGSATSKRSPLLVQRCTSRQNAVS